MPTRREFDHIGSHRFKVEIEGVEAGRFQADSEFGAEVEVIEFEDGDDLLLSKRPGRVRYDDVVLTIGYINTNVLWDWWKEVQEGRVQRKSISIILNDSAGGEIRRWVLHGCWPRRWQSEPLNGEISDRLVEQIVVVVEEMDVGR